MDNLEWLQFFETMWDDLCPSRTYVWWLFYHDWKCMLEVVARCCCTWIITGIDSHDWWRYEAVAERRIRHVNLPVHRYRTAESGTHILCHRDKTSRTDKSTLMSDSDNKPVPIRFCGDASLQKAHNIMRAKSCIGIVEKRHLAKRQIHEVTGECKKDTCKMRTLISGCAWTLCICPFQTVSSTPLVKRRKRVKAKGSPKYTFGTTSQGTLSVFRIKSVAKSKSRQPKHNNTVATSSTVLSPASLPRRTIVSTQTVNYSPVVITSQAATTTTTHTMVLSKSSSPAKRRVGLPAFKVYTYQFGGAWYMYLV